MWPFKKLLEALKELKPDEAPVLYVYRAAPKINRQLSGKKGSQIDRLIPPMPADIPAYLRATHGGGVYDIWLNADNREDTGICKGRVEIPTTEVDPILDPRELVRGDVQNEQLIQKWMMEGKVKQDAGGLIMFTNGSEKEPAKDYATSRLVDVAIESMKGKEEKQPSLLEIIQVVAALQPKQAAGESTNTVLMEMLKGQREEAAALRAEIRELSQKKVSESDPVDSAERMIAFAREMNPQGAKSGTDWGAILGPAVAAAMPFLMRFAGAALPAAGAPTPNPAPQPAAQTTATADAQAASADTDRILAAAVRAIVNGRTGGDFAESFCDIWTDQAYAGLAAYGPAPLIQAISGHAAWLATPPEGRGQNQPERFVHEFLTAFDQDEQTDADTPPAAAPEVVKTTSSKKGKKETAANVN